MPKEVSLINPACNSVLKVQQCLNGLQTFSSHRYMAVARSKNSVPIIGRTASYVHVLRPYGRNPGAYKVHLLLCQVDVRSNYYASHAGMRNWKMTRNVCITLSQMFILGSRNRRGRSSPRLSSSSRRVVGARFASSPYRRSRRYGFVFPRACENAVCLLTVNHIAHESDSGELDDESNSLLALMRARVKWSVRDASLRYLDA